MDRPTSITVISWIMMIGGGLSLLMLLALTDPDLMVVWTGMGISTSALLLTISIGSVVQFASGYAIHGGRAWGRTLYTAYVVLSLGAGLFLMPAGTAPGGLVMGVVSGGALLFFLYRPVANRFFEGIHDPVEDTQRNLQAVRIQQRNPSDVAQIFGVGALIGSGFFLMLSFVTIGMSDTRGWFLASLMVTWTPAAALCAMGIFLWGKQRWAAALGWVLLVSGAFTALYVGMMASMMSSPAYNDLLRNTLDAEGAAAFDTTEMIGRMVPGGVLAGILALIGGALLYLQVEKDRRAAQNPPDQA